MMAIVPSSGLLVRSERFSRTTELLSQEESCAGSVCAAVAEKTALSERKKPLIRWKT